MEITLTLTRDEIVVVLRGLDNLPHGQSRNVVDKILSQANPQVLEKQIREAKNASETEVQAQ